ncbi:MAG: aminotransferase class I/II-fold pyridoxal phosphate-dependent enzyme, partial [Pseudomonadales bacterium]|nr:aminotransferase class I/II-fold pyridoxal phosphate-dependent enzyme [Pseudomonadales bacterium]
MTYERDNIRAMEGYAYGEQPTNGEVVKLNTNENPYPPTPLIKSTLKNFDIDLLRRYPDPTADGLRQLVASRLDVTADNVLVTNGGDEGLRLAVTTLVNPDGVLGMVDPSYSLYPVLANIQGCRVESLRLENNWTLPEGFSAQMNASGAQLTCLVNPHAPSGVLCPLDALREVAEALKGVLLIDEA